MIDTNIKQKKRISTDIAQIALTCALLLGGQFVFSFIVGVEIVTLIFVCFAFVFGARRGIICAVIFSILQCVLYGFYPTVAILYFIYYPLLATVFGLIGKFTFFKVTHTAKWEILKVVSITVIAAIMTATFTLLDDIITPLFYGLSQGAALAYFYTSLTAMVPQIICTIVSVGTLFLPITTALKKITKK